jgi:ATP-binding cassette, subfamily C (CFTR/MRP), member 1
MITAQLVTFFAQNEQNMNAVERVLVYTELVPEGDVVTSHDPPPTWPDKGEITFTDVQLVYREGLPLALKNVSFQIKPGEKVRKNTCEADAGWANSFQVGIVGRTVS